MNTQFIKKNWQVLEAIKQGRTVQYSYVQGEWWDYCDRYDMNTNHEWRIKPEVTTLKVGDKIHDQDGRVYSMFCLFIERTKYLMPVRVDETGSITRLIEPIKCDDYGCITLEELQSKIHISKVYNKVEK